MGNDKIKYNRLNTIRWKAVISASVGTLLLCAAVLLVYHKVIDQKLSEYSRQKNNIQNETYSALFVNQLHATIFNLNAQAEALTEQIQQIGNAALPVTTGVMSSYLKKDATLKSVFLISEPYVLTNSDSLLVNTNPGFPIGWYGKFTRHENTGTPELSNDLQATPNEVYDLYRDTKHDITSKIQSLNIDGEASNTLVSLIPFFNKGKFAGVIGAEIDMKYYRNILDETIPSDQYYIIADKNGFIFYSRKKEYQNRHITEALRFTEEKFNIMAKTGENLPADVETNLMEDDNRSVYLHNKKISMPYTNDFFAIISITPSISIKAEQLKAEGSVVVIALILLAIFVIAVIIITGYITKPLAILGNTVKKIAGGNFDIDNGTSTQALQTTEFASILHSLQNLTNSLKQTADFASEIRMGNLDAQYKVSIKNNAIGTALVSMRDSMIETRDKEQKRIAEEKRTQWATEGHSIFSDILRNSISDIHKLSNDVIDNLVPYINVNQGGIFIRTKSHDDPEKEVLELYGVFAFGHERFHKRILQLDEGLIGACAMEKHTIVLNNVPDNYADISSGLGKAKPKAIMFVPLVYNDTLYGVMEFASFKEFEPYQISFVERISENVASTIANAKINEQTAELLQQSRLQSKQMEEKEANLRSEIETLSSLVETSQYELSQIEKTQYALNRAIMSAVFSLKGETLDANRKFCLRYTLDVNDLKRKNIYEIFQLTLAKYDDFKRVWDSVKQGGTETYVTEFKINNSIRKIRNMLVPIYDTDNTVEKILCLSFDVTSQINTEEELAKIQKQYATVSEDAKNMKKQIKAFTEDIEQLNRELTDSKRQNVENRQKFDKASASEAFFKRELEKRITKFRKIEANLKNKVKVLESQIEEQGKKNKEDQDHTENNQQQ